MKFYWYLITQLVLVTFYLCLVDFKMTCLVDFGYYFDADGTLKNIDGSGQGFVFDVYGDHDKNQDRYEQLGEVIDRFIYRLLEDEASLKKIYIPLNTDEKQPRGFIFASAGYEKEEKLVLLIHGSGVVRAGQWSRKLIINNSLNEGSQLPYIKKARELGYGVLVLNSNQNYDEAKMMPIPGSESPEKHMHYVWKNIVEPCSAKHIAIVAHSYGGVITVKEATTNKEMREKTFAVAFTDSVHGYMKRQGDDFLTWLQNTACNWVSSEKELDAGLVSYDCRRVSAGTPIHERTSWRAFDSVWRFINEKLDERIHQKKDYDTQPISSTVTTETEVTQSSKPAKNKKESNSSESEIGQPPANEKIESTAKEETGGKEAIKPHVTAYNHPGTKMPEGREFESDIKTALLTNIASNVEEKSKSENKSSLKPELHTNTALKVEESSGEVTNNKGIESDSETNEMSELEETEEEMENIVEPAVEEDSHKERFFLFIYLFLIFRWICDAIKKILFPTKTPKIKKK